MKKIHDNLERTTELVNLDFILGVTKRGFTHILIQSKLSGNIVGIVNMVYTNDPDEGYKYKAKFFGEDEDCSFQFPKPNFKLEQIESLVYSETLKDTEHRVLLFLFVRSDLGMEFNPRTDSFEKTVYIYESDVMPLDKALGFNIDFIEFGGSKNRIYIQYSFVPIILMRYKFDTKYNINKPIHRYLAMNKETYDIVLPWDDDTIDLYSKLTKLFVANRINEGKNEMDKPIILGDIR